MSTPFAIVSVSGGKDSLATLLVAIERYGRQRVRPVYADTGHDLPMVVDYVQGYLPTALGIPITTVRADFTMQIERKRVFIAEHGLARGWRPERIALALEHLHPTGNPFLDLCMWKGRFPSRKAQFCTEELKSIPLDKFMVEQARSAGGFDQVESWQGVRRNESEARKDALEWERADGGWMIHRPIVEWTAEQAFAKADEHGIKHNPLYRMGFGRVGCMTCINCGKDEIRLAADAFPEQIDRMEAWELLVGKCAKRGVSTFYHVNMDREQHTVEEVFGLANIREMVHWSRTSHGGKQMDLLRAEGMAETGCTSKYGLCE